jgi:hypothetical protein
VLVRTGETVDILFDVTNPGLWMAHCHIAEHMQKRHDVQLQRGPPLIGARPTATRSNKEGPCKRRCAITHHRIGCRMRSWSAAARPVWRSPGTSKRQGLRFVVLEAGSELGHTWRDRWDLLKLFTPAQ